MTEYDFVNKLTEYHGTNVFNPWLEIDGEYDIGANAPVIRRERLLQYLQLRAGAKLILVAEAIGYQGGHFSGIAMTSERMLLGYHSVKPEQIVGTGNTQRTSDSKKLSGPVAKMGFNEPTDTVVWGTILEEGFNPFEVLLWNIFPFHPYKVGNVLSNRTPTEEELDRGYEYFKMLRDMHKSAKFVAIGQKAANTLQKYGFVIPSVRHPSNGGANEFREGMRKLKLR